MLRGGLKQTRKNKVSSQVFFPSSVFVRLRSFPWELLRRSPLVLLFHCLPATYSDKGEVAGREGGERVREAGQQASSHVQWQEMNQNHQEQFYLSSTLSGLKGMIMSPFIV